MKGSLGEKIGEGAFADVHAWAPGQVFKLSKPGIPQWVVQHETHMTRAVFAAAGPAPEVLGEITLDHLADAEMRHVRDGFVHRRGRTWHYSWISLTIACRNHR